jgi:hypothetical protein
VSDRRKVRAKRRGVQWTRAWRGCWAATWSEYRLTVEARGGSGWRWTARWNTQAVACGYAPEQRAAEAEALRAAQEDAATRLALAAEHRLDLMARYAQHTPWCGKNAALRCSCGLEDLMR